MSILILALLLATNEPKVEVQTLDGQKLTGSIARLGSDGLALTPPGSQAVLALNQLASVTVNGEPGKPEVSPPIRVELTDGSTIAAEQVTAAEGKVDLVLAGGRHLPLGASQVAAVQLQPITGALEGEWRRVRESHPTADQLVIRKAEALDDHQGTVHQITPDEVRFEIEGERLPIKRTKVFGLIYFHRARGDLPPAIGRLAAAGGSQWVLASLRLSESGRLEWTTPAGAQGSSRIADVRRIDFASDQLVYLSDLKPESVHWTPFFGFQGGLEAMSQYYGPRFDRKPEEGGLRLGGKQYRKGLAIHSRTLLVYRLPEKIRRFQAMAGIDDQFRPHGSVRLVLQGDGRVLWEKAVTGEDPPVAIDVNLEGVRRFTILVDFGANASFGDHLLLGEARLRK